MTEAASLGIIGGADGPTVIFVASPDPLPLLLAAAALVIAILLLIRHFRKR